MGLTGAGLPIRGMMKESTWAMATKYNFSRFCCMYLPAVVLMSPTSQVRLFGEPLDSTNVIEVFSRTAGASWPVSRVSRTG